MTDTACSHRWVLARFFTPDLDEPDDIEHEFIASDSCDGIGDLIDLMKSDPTTLALEVMGTKFRHFTMWLERQVRLEQQIEDTEP